MLPSEPRGARGVAADATCRGFPGTPAAAGAFGLVLVLPPNHAQGMAIQAFPGLDLSFTGLAASLVVVLGVIVWYAFRPERLFIDRTVNETVPVTTAASSADAVSLAKGTFHSNAHETIGTATILSLSDGRRILRGTISASPDAKSSRFASISPQEWSSATTRIRAKRSCTSTLVPPMGRSSPRISSTKGSSLSLWSDD